MKQQDVIDFFDSRAGQWDAELIRNEAVIARILDNCALRPGFDVLDVACGTGVLFGDYIARGAAHISAIDIAPQMVRIAATKFPQQVQVMCGDVEQTEFERRFDLVMLYNALPHFPQPERLIERLSSLLKPGGRLCVAHGMSRAAIDQHHTGSAAAISNGLMAADELAALFEPWLQVEVIISDAQMYQVTGGKR